MTPPPEDSPAPPEVPPVPPGVPPAQSHPPEHPPVPPAARFRFLPPWLGLLIVVLGAAGGGLLYATWPDPAAAPITRIRIEKSVAISNPSGAMQDTMNHLKSWGTTPSLFLEVLQSDGADPITTPARNNTPVGNGLTFTLPEPVALGRITEVRIRDDDRYGDRMIDRVDVDTPHETGQIFSVHLMGPAAAPGMPSQRLTGWGLVIAAAAGLGGATVRFVVLQVV